MGNIFNKIFGKKKELKMPLTEFSNYLKSVPILTIPQDSFRAYLRGEKVITINLEELKNKQAEYKAYQEKWKKDNR